MTAPAQEPISMRERLRTDYGWTERQRQVLDLMARGKTNTEIAEALGVSLAGAKWHVSEILSKLQAESREEAAEYWRRYNGLAPRFARVFRGMVGAVGLKWVLSGGIAVAGGLIAVLAVALALRNETDDGPHQAATVEPSLTAIPTATASASTSPQPGGITVGSFTLADPVATLPAESVMYTVTGCWQCDGPDVSLRRHVTRGGATTTETIIESDKGVLDGWKVGGITGSADGSLLAVLVCNLRFCGPWIDYQAVGEFRVLWSFDGGESWAEAWRTNVEMAWLARSSSSAGVIVRVANRSVMSEGGSGLDEHFFAVLRTGTVELQRPPEAGAYGGPHLLDDGSVVWSVVDSNNNAAGLIASDGGPSTLDIPSGSYVGELSQAGGVTAVPWGNAALALFNTSGNKLAEFQTEGVYSIALLTPDLAIGNISHQSLGWANTPAFFDLTRASITPFNHPDFSDGGRNRFIAFRQGPFAKVAGAGDCLNVREQASMSAPIVRCFVDGVLLRDLGETADADGVRWLKVATPDGREGWASTEFLER